MSDSTETLEVTKRTRTGTAESRRLRREGKIPAVLYGHGESNEHLAIPAVQVNTILRHNSRAVALAGDIEETALISDVHYDPLGIDVLHLDLIRVNLKEKVELTVTIHTHGQCKGVNEGGILLETLHEVDVRCPAGSIPESLDVDVSNLGLNEHLSAGSLQLPDGVELITDADTVIVRVEEPRSAAADEETTQAISGEPEVISKGGGDDESDDQG